MPSWFASSACQAGSFAAREKAVRWRTHAEDFRGGSCANQPPAIRHGLISIPLIALLFAMSNPGPHPPFLASDLSSPFSRLFRSHSGQLRFSTKVLLAVILPLQSPAVSRGLDWQAGPCRRGPIAGPGKGYDIRSLSGVASLVQSLGRVLRRASSPANLPVKPLAGLDDVRLRGAICRRAAISRAGDAVLGHQSICVSSRSACSISASTTLGS